MVNKVFLIGRLGRDPEVRSTPSGQTVANFSLATNRVWRDREGARQEQTEWHQIVVWGRQAEVAGQYLTRGRQVFIEGRMQTRSWDDRQTGEKRYRTEVVVENFQMLGSRGDGESGGSGGGSWGGGGGGGSYGTGPGGGSAGADPSAPSYDPDPSPSSGGPGGGDFSPEPEDDDIPF